MPENLKQALLEILLNADLRQADAAARELAARYNIKDFESTT